jgi:3-oxoacyl-[acyl-carrier protein] reductase
VNRFVVVSGGGTGIGKAIARSFAVQGDRVLIVGRRAELLVEASRSIGSHASSGGSNGSYRDLDTPSSPRDRAP